MEGRRRRLSLLSALLCARRLLTDAGHLSAIWNARQEARRPTLFSPTIGAAIAAQYWLLWVCCPGCWTANAVDLSTVDRHPDAAVTSLIPGLSCRSRWPNVPFAELLRLSPKSIAHENCQICDRRAGLYQPAA
jgi:hypothetical protein